MENEKLCKLCGKVFKPISSKQIFCSYSCKEKCRVDKRREERHNQKKPISIKTCPVCGKEFISEARTNKFCSRPCAYKSSLENNNKLRTIDKTGKIIVCITSSEEEKEEVYTGILD